MKRAEISTTPAGFDLATEIRQLPGPSRRTTECQSIPPVVEFPDKSGWSNCPRHLCPLSNVERPTQSRNLLSGLLAICHDGFLCSASVVCLLGSDARLRSGRTGRRLAGPHPLPTIAPIAGTNCELGDQPSVAIRTAYPLCGRTQSSYQQRHFCSKPRRKA